MRNRKRDLIAAVMGFRRGFGYSGHTGSRSAQMFCYRIRPVFTRMDTVVIPDTKALDCKALNNGIDSRGIVMAVAEEEII